MKKKSNIYTIADQAGVSPITVSRVFSGKMPVAQATRKKILEVANTLNYQPNYLSRALAGGRSMSIGVLAGSLEALIEVSRIQAMENAAKDAGYMAYLVGSGSAEKGRQEQWVQDLLNRRIDGLLVYQVLPASSKTLEILRSCEIPTVFLDWTPDGAEWFMSVDVRNAYRQLAEHLKSRGCRRLAMMQTQFHLAHPERKLQICREELAEASIQIDISERWRVPARMQYENIDEAGTLVAQRWLEASERPRVILCTNDDLAAALVAAFADHGIHVPGEVAVIGTNDDPIANLVRPRLTTIRQPRKVFGANAFEVLLRLMEGKPDLARKVQNRFDCQLVIRESG